MFFSLLFLGSLLKTIDAVCKFNSGNVMLYKCNWPFIQRRFSFSLHILASSWKKKIKEKRKKFKHSHIFLPKEVRGRCYKDQTIKRNWGIGETLIKTKIWLSLEMHRTGLFQEEKMCLAVAFLGDLDTERRKQKIRAKL